MYSHLLASAVTGIGKPRLTAWGNPNQFVVHRGDDRMLFDLTWFADEEACWRAVNDWLAGAPAGFDLTKRLELARVGLFAVYRPVWTGIEVANG